MRGLFDTNGGIAYTNLQYEQERMDIHGKGLIHST